jgi:hypothetical protein
LKKNILIFLLIAPTLFAGGFNTGWKVILSKAGRSNEIKGSELIQIDVFKEDGEKAYTIAKSVPYNMSSLTASVFETGELMVVYSKNGMVEFYNTSGNLVNKISAKSDSEDGSIIKFETVNDKSALLISEPKSGSTRLVIVSSDGEIIFEKSLEGNHPTGVELSLSGQNIAAGTYSWIDTAYSEQTIFVNSKGKIKGKINRSFSKGLFSKDEDEFLGFTNSDLFIIELPEIKIKWVNDFPSDINLIDAAILDKDKIVLTSDLPFLKNSKWLYPNLVLSIFDDYGKLIDKKKIENDAVESAKLIIEGNQYVLNLDGKIFNP